MKHTLTSAQKAEFRGQAQRLDAHIHIGKNGLTPQVLKEVANAFNTHELVKIKFQAEREAIQDFCKRIEEASESTCVGGVGKVASFYKQKPKAKKSEVDEDAEEEYEDDGE